MHPNVNESSLMGFFELLRSWEDTCAASDLRTVLETIHATLRKGDHGTVEVMCGAVQAVTGIAVTITEPSAWATSKLN